MPYLLIIVVVVAAAVALVLIPSGATEPKPIVRVSGAGPVTLRERCPVAQRAISFYRQKYAAHRQAMRAAGPVPRAWYGCDAARRRAGEWKEKAAAARLALSEWTAYHYHWQDWLPENWQRLGACETGYGRRPGNFAHANSRFVSAFGISRSIYDRDAAYHDVRPWSDDPAHRPTPREQYLAALGHYAMFGDGWTCPGP